MVDRVADAALQARLGRRAFLRGVAGAGVLATFGSLAPAWARAARAPLAPGAVARAFVDGETSRDLRIAPFPFAVADERGKGVAINGSIPGPLVRLRENRDVTLRVSNGLDVDTSIHWHGLLVPVDMDGVPGLSFPGIAPSQTWEYRFRTKQSGTYWYHSHSGLQEQSGVYGPLIIDPEEPREHDRVERDYPVLLSDWTFEAPERVARNLKANAEHYNRQPWTLRELPGEIREHGLAAALRERFDWAWMRMDRADLSDVTGVTYTYLCNGLPPDPARGWWGEFAPGDRIRLRLINGSAMTFFDVRIPGLPMTVVQADGQDVTPVEVDELRIGVAETYDVVVQPREARAYALFAESLDRSGFALGTLAPTRDALPTVPAIRRRALRSMADMGHGGHVGHSGSDSHAGHAVYAEHATRQEHATHGEHATRDEHALHGEVPSTGEQEPMAGHGGHAAHAPAAAAVPAGSRLDEPGIGLGDDGWRVLVYGDLRSLHPVHLPEPTRELELHLTGNMQRYMWSFDGLAYSEVDGPIDFHSGECLRLTLINDTMMEHPIHLHGMWMVLENGAAAHRPRKHTITLQPAARVSVVVDVDAPEGDWAFHCHLLYHMNAGMMRTVRVGPDTSVV